MPFVGPDMLHGFHERLVPELYPTDFHWAPSWDEVRMDSNNDSSGVTRSGVCVRSVQMDHDEAVLFRAVSRLHDFAREPDRRPFFLFASFTHPLLPCHLCRWTRAILVTLGEFVSTRVRARLIYGEVGRRE